MGGACGTFWGGGDVQLEGRRPLGRPRRRFVGICVIDFAILHFVTPGSEGYHISVMALGHSLTRSGLTYPEVLSKVYYDSFCQLGSSVSLPWVIYFEDLMFIGPYIILIDK